MVRMNRLPLFRPVLVVLLLVVMTAATEAAQPIPVIFDTDMSSDVDDVGAATILHALADSGEAKILAMGLSDKYPESALCLSAINSYFGRPDIPIGVPKGDGISTGSKYAATIASEYPRNVTSWEELPEAADVYRKTLAEAKDGSVVMISVGFTTNFATLLQSKGDDISPLSGAELIRKKVRVWVCMGGKFPSGKEWNVYRHAAASQTAIGGFTAPILFSGFEIGQPIGTGLGLKALPTTSPVRRAYELYNGLNNRSSWDQTAVLYAVRGLDGGLANMWDISEPGRCTVQADGNNGWQADPKGTHTYLIKKMSNEDVARELEKLMMHQPK